MARPWSEGAALLAVAGRDAGPIPPPRSIWSRLMSQHIDFAFLSRMDGHARPIVFNNLGGLARYIERKRYGQGIRLEEVHDIHARRRAATGGTDTPPEGVRDRGVQIHTLTLDGDLDRSMGFAWLKGGGREDLIAALTRAAFAQGLGDRHLMQAA